MLPGPVTVASGSLKTFPLITEGAMISSVPPAETPALPLMVTRLRLTNVFCNPRTAKLPGPAAANVEKTVDARAKGAMENKTKDMAIIPIRFHWRAGKTPALGLARTAKFRTGALVINLSTFFLLTQSVESKANQQDDNRPRRTGKT